MAKKRVPVRKGTTKVSAKQTKGPTLPDIDIAIRRMIDLQARRAKRAKKAKETELKFKRNP